MKNFLICLLLAVFLSVCLSEPINNSPAELPSVCGSCIGETGNSCGESINNTAYCCEECLPRGYTNCGCNEYRISETEVVHSCFGCPSGSRCVDNTNVENAVLRRFCVSSSSTITIPLALISVFVLVLLGW